MTKTNPKKKKCKKAKWLSDEVLQIWGLTNSQEKEEKWKEKRKKGVEKWKREKERYIQLNAEFQRIAKRDEKVLTEQLKETEENNRMGKTSDLFMEIGDSKGTFHAKTSTTKSRRDKEEVARS